MLFTVWVWLWLNFDTILVPSANRICTDVVGWDGSKGTVGGAKLTDDSATSPVVAAGDGDERETTSGA